MKEKEIEKEEQDLFDILFDENNEDPITLYDENDKEIIFDQVAIIPHDKQFYAILKPISEMENVGEDEAIVFLIEENEEGECVLTIEQDEKVATAVFDAYYKLLEQAEKDAE